MQEVPIERQRIAGVHLDVDAFEPFERRIDMLSFSVGLAILANVIEPLSTCRQPFSRVARSSAT
jgi:hypothetical protein